MVLNPLVSLFGHVVVRSGRKRGNRQTDRQTDKRNDRPSTVTLAAHARRGLNMYIHLYMYTTSTDACGAVLIGYAVYSWDSTHSYHVCLPTEICTAQTTTGDEPPSLNGCTLTLIDQHKAVLFGGYDGHEYRNDTYLLDMEKWVYACYCSTDIYDGVV